MPRKLTPHFTFNFIKNTFYGYSDIGQCRKNNEDAFPVQYLWNKQNLLVIVADGIGGNEGGKIGSYTTCKCVLEYLNNTTEKFAQINILRQALIYANNAIITQQRNPYLYNMGCVTTTVLFDFEHKTAHMYYIGDTHFYQYKSNRLYNISQD